MGYNYTMQIIHTTVKKKKAKKPTAKQRQLQSDWEKLLKKYAPTKRVSGVSASKPKTYVRETKHIPSLPFTGAPCVKKENPVYTGTAIKGIGTMHKSNAVPIFSDEQAIEIATMRRN